MEIITKPGLAAAQRFDAVLQIAAANIPMNAFIFDSVCHSRFAIN